MDVFIKAQDKQAENDIFRFRIQNDISRKCFSKYVNFLDAYGMFMAFSESLLNFVIKLNKAEFLGKICCDRNVFQTVSNLNRPLRSPRLHKVHPDVFHSNDACAFMPYE